MEDEVIEVIECIDCPMNSHDRYEARCGDERCTFNDSVIEKGYDFKCPLRNKSITIKLSKDNKVDAEYLQ